MREGDKAKRDLTLGGDRQISGPPRNPQFVADFTLGVWQADAEHGYLPHASEESTSEITEPPNLFKIR